MRYLSILKLWKLIHMVMLVITLSPVVSAQAGNESMQQEAQKLWESNQESVRKNIMDKYLELQNMTTGEQQADLLEMVSQKPRLRVFVSSSMGKNLLKHYAKEAKKYKATLVFRGLPNGSSRL